jgi:hypothetical protein
MPIIRSNRKLEGGLDPRQEETRNEIEARRIAALAEGLGRNSATTHLRSSPH